MKMGADRHYVNTARKGVVTMTENEAIEALRLINTSKVHLFYSREELAEVRDIAISTLEEIQQYREIGTVEECRETVEKQKPKKSEIYTDTVQTINGSFQRDVFECPVCGEYICNVEDEIPRYCSSCGQKLEESEE